MPSILPIENDRHGSALGQTDQRQYLEKSDLLTVIGARRLHVNPPREPAREISGSAFEIQTKNVSKLVLNPGNVTYDLPEDDVVDVGVGR